MSQIKNILLAEDDRGTAMLVKKQLEANGYLIDIARNGIEALKLITTKKFDLLITDVVMPQMDGVDLYGAVKQNPKINHIPIIIVTDKAIFKESFTSLGVSNFVEKTTDISKLIEKIHDVEKESDEIKSYRKILLCSTSATIIKQMQTAMQGMKFLIAVASTGDDVIAKALTMTPHIIAIDVLFQDNVSSYELIRALRSFSVLKNLKIITYVYFPEDLGMDVDAVESVKNAIRQCTDAGSDKYIGRFNQGFFLEKIMDLNVS